MIKNVIFDVGMVLVDFCYRDYMKELGIDDKTTEFLAVNMVQNELWNRLDEGMPVKEFCEMFQGMYPDLSDVIGLFFKDMTNIVRSYDYSRDWLRSLRNEGLGVYILSNYPGELFTLHENTSFTFTKETNGMVVSGRVKLRKPFKEIYEYLLDTYGLVPEECVFIDDRQENIDMARSIGIKGIVFKGYEDANAKLRELIDNE